MESAYALATDVTDARDSTYATATAVRGGGGSASTHGRGDAGVMASAFRAPVLRASAGPAVTGPATGRPSSSASTEGRVLTLGRSPYLHVGIGVDGDADADADEDYLDTVTEEDEIEDVYGNMQNGTLQFDSPMDMPGLNI